MKKSTQKGFSLIELLIVIVIIGIIASVAVPALLKARLAAENGNTFASTKSLYSTQVSFFASNGRYARLNELNALTNNTFGAFSNNKILRGKYTFEMIPSNPTDAQLREGFVISVTKTGVLADELPYTLSLDQSGKIITPF